MPGFRYFFRSFCVIAALTLTTVSLGSCHLAKNQMVYDRASEKDMQEYRDALGPSAPLPPETPEALDFQPFVATPADLKLPSPLVTVSVNQTVSLRDLMFELAEQANVDLELDPQIRGSIIFTAKDRPFNDVVERICEMSGLRYLFKNNVLRVELDRPFVKNYKVDYLNLTRSSTSSINSSVSVSGTTEGTSTGAGSNSSINSTYNSNFWKEIDEGLKQILTASDTFLSLATLADPVATPIAPPPPPVPVVDPNNPTPPPPPAASTVPPSLNVAQAPVTPLMPNPPSTYSISKEAGVVSVFANERQHKMIKKFFEMFRRTSMTQVLIEAKVLEVSLNDEFATGVDWGTFNLTGLATINSEFTQPDFAVPLAAINPGSVFTASLNLGDVKPVISALTRFGTVRTLSSPRVTVMNNQPAVVNMTRNRVYFSIETTITPASAVGVQPTITSTATPKSAPEGVLMNVLPTANSDTGEVILAIRPTISKTNRDVPDPTNADNLIPEMSVQEIDSIVKIQSGQTLVMGGLMKDGNTIDQDGIPVLGDLPGIGALFRKHHDNIQKSELVILLKATIIPGANADETDRRIYKDFGQDRRPARL